MMAGEYGDIVHLPHHVSSKRPRRIVQHNFRLFRPSLDMMMQSGRLVD